MKLRVMEKDGFTTKSCYIEIRSFQQYEGFTTHWHKYIELELVLEGEGTHILNGVKYHFERGDAWIISYSGSHSVSIDTPVKILNISFNEALFNPTISAILFSHASFACRFTEDEFKFIENLSSQLLSENENKLYSYDLISSVITQLVINILRRSSTSSEVMPSIIQKAVNYIHKNYTNDILLVNVAKELSISKNYLGRLFRDTLGVNFNEYVKSLRLRQACSLLKSSQLSIKEIAFSSGFNSPIYFCNIFKEKMSMSPMQYRNSSF